MNISRTENTNMQFWQEPDWSIRPHNFLATEVFTAPPTIPLMLEELLYDQIQSGGPFVIGESKPQTDDDSEDIQLARGTKLKYGMHGPANFVRYRDYRKKRVREK